MTDAFIIKVMFECTSLRSQFFTINFETGLKKSTWGIQKVSKKLTIFLLNSVVIRQRWKMCGSHSVSAALIYCVMVNRINKTALSSLDDKQLLVESGIQPFAYCQISLNETSTR